MTLTAMDHPIGTTQALFPTAEPKPGHTATDRVPIRHGQTLEWQDRDYIIVDVNAERTAALAARLPIRRDTTLFWTDAQTLKAEAVKAQRTAVDEQIGVDALLDLQYLSGAQMRAFTNDLKRHPDVHILDTRPVPNGHLCIRCSTPHVLRTVIAAYRTIAIIGVDYLMPTPMLHTLSSSARQLRLESPSISTGIAIAEGERLSLDDCHRRHLWVEPEWDGGVVVLPLTCDSGHTIYEILGTRYANHRVRERDWICDCDTLAEAVDVAGLLRASYDGLIREIKLTGETPSVAAQKG